MKICVVSDSHGDREILQSIRFRHPDCHIYLHLGDSQLDEQWIAPFVSVKGNCDSFCDYPHFRIIDTPYGKIYAEHGHRTGRVDVDFLKRNGCKIYLSGHTHVHALEKRGEYIFANPGSLTRPRDGTNGTYLLVELTETSANFLFREV